MRSNKPRSVNLPKIRFPLLQKRTGALFEFWGFEGATEFVDFALHAVDVRAIEIAYTFEDFMKGRRTLSANF